MMKYVAVISLVWSQPKRLYNQAIGGPLCLPMLISMQIAVIPINVLENQPLQMLGL